MSNNEEDTRPSKRQRTNENEGGESSGDGLPATEHADDDAEPRVRDSRYYFDDGNIVLEAEGTLFRVHKGILALHSGFFKDMLNLPQDTSPEYEVEDGCPLVRTHDTVLHVSWLLETMYNGSTTKLLSPRPPRARDIAIFYDLSYIGDKYAVQPLVDHVYQKLCLLFPTESLANWRPCKHLELEDLVSAAEMIRLWHPRAIRLLPLVFYAYCQLPPISVDNNESHTNASDEVLSSEDEERCRLAIPVLFKRKLEACNVFTATGPRQQCEMEIVCNSTLLQLSHAIMKREDMATLPNPLENLVLWCRQRKLWKNLCAPCSQEILAEIARLRQATWNDLGVIFNIPEWQSGDAAQAQCINVE